MRAGWYRLAPTARVSPARPPNPYYVDTVTGTTGGTGTSASRQSSITAAMAAVAGSPDQVIKVNAPITAPLRTSIIYESSLALIVEGINGVPWYAYGSDQVTSGWTGAGPVYAHSTAGVVAGATITTLTEVIDGRTFYVKLTPNTVTPTTPGVGEYGSVGTVVYVRLPGDASPNSHTIELHRRAVASFTTLGFGTLIVRNIVARFGAQAGILNGLSTQPDATGRLTVEDSEISYNSDGVGASGRNELTSCLRVKAWRNYNDGFNHHAVNPGALMVLNDCNGSYNGDQAGTSSQGASNHQETVMIINGGRYDYNVSGGMVVVGDARCDIHGDTPYGPVIMDRNMRLGNTAGTVAGQAGCAWLENTRGAVTGPVTVSNGLGRGVARAAGAVVTGINGIVSTGNAVTPDFL